MARHTHTSTQRVIATATRVVSAPMRAFGPARSKPAPVSESAKTRIAAARQAFNDGAITRQDFDSLKQSYEYFGQREAAGYPAFDLGY